MVRARWQAGKNAMWQALASGNFFMSKTRYLFLLLTSACYVSPPVTKSIKIEKHLRATEHGQKH